MIPMNGYRGRGKFLFFPLFVFKIKNKPSFALLTAFPSPTPSPKAAASRRISRARLDDAGRLIESEARPLFVRVTA